MPLEPLDLVRKRRGSLEEGDADGDTRCPLLVKMEIPFAEVVKVFPPDGSNGRRARWGHVAPGGSLAPLRVSELALRELAHPIRAPRRVPDHLDRRGFDVGNLFDGGFDLFR